MPNATFALNIVARSLNLGPGDEVLTSDHEYGACNHVWRFLAGKRGFRYVAGHVPLPLEADEAFVARFWTAVTPATRVIFLSHITSLTAQRFPVAALCARAREAGILTVIDGAHAVGQIPLDMGAIGADFYFSNAHKWLCAPKGAAFLYARRDKQPLLEPLVVGWGWGPERTLSYGSDFLDFNQWLGTNDFAAYLSVPAAIAFQEENDWSAVRRACHALLSDALARIGDLTGQPSAYPDDSAYGQLAIAPLPPMRDLRALQQALYDEYFVEVPCTEWNGQPFIRVSIQGYNTMADVDALLGALEALLPLHRA